MLHKFVLLILIVILSCAQGPKDKDSEAGNGLRIKKAEVTLPPSFEKAQDLLLRMTPEEKVQLLKSYITLRSLSTGHINPTVSSARLIHGIPRLGIPSIELMKEDEVSLTNAAPERVEGEVLKLGSVNLIRNFEKEQVYGNFAQSDKVDSVLSPGGRKKMPELETNGYDLQDLDLFMVKSGSEETGARDYICAIHRKTDKEYTCVESKFEQSVKELGLETSLSEALEKNKLTPTQMDSLVLRMLASMYELKIIK